MLLIFTAVIEAYILPLILAYLVIGLCLRRSLATAPLLLQSLIYACLAVGLSFGLTSIGLFLWLNVARQAGSAYIIVELMSCSGIAAASLWAGRHLNTVSNAGDRISFRDAIHGLSRVQVLALAGFGIGCLFVLVWLLYFVLQLPHGEWDAWAIWNMRARYLYRAQEFWPVAFNTLMPHTDYPLLIPLTVMRGWVYLGTETQIIPAFVSVAFAVAVLCLLVTALVYLRGMLAGLAAGSVLIATPFFFQQGAAQTADVPLVFFILATLVLIMIYERGRSRVVLALAGIFAGLAGWTKNEGLLFMTATSVALVITASGDSDWKHRISGIAPFLAGVLPVLLVIITFKVLYAPPNDLIAGQGAQTIYRLLDVQRYAQIASALVEETLRDYAWFPVLSAGLLVGGLYKPKAACTMFTVLGIVFVGYYFIYVTTPLNLTYHLTSSLSRLLLHLWPGFIFAAFGSAKLIARPVGESSIEPARTVQPHRVIPSSPPET